MNMQNKKAVSLVNICLSAKNLKDYFKSHYSPNYPIRNGKLFAEMMDEEIVMKCIQKFYEIHTVFW